MPETGWPKGQATRKCYWTRVLKGRARATYSGFSGRSMMARMASRGELPKCRML
jgi:hypothetical protein